MYERTPLDREDLTAELKQRLFDFWAETGAEWVSGLQLPVSGCLGLQQQIHTVCIGLAGGRGG